MRDINHFIICRNGTSKQGGDANPFDEEEWDEGDNEALVDNGEPGVPVKALYDYEGAESDELSFKQGQIVQIYSVKCNYVTMNIYLKAMFSKNWRMKMNRAGARAAKTAEWDCTQRITSNPLAIKVDNTVLKTVPYTPDNYYVSCWIIIYYYI